MREKSRFFARHRRGFAIAASLLGGVVLGALGVLSIPLFVRDSEAAPPIAEPEAATKAPGGGFPQMGGDVQTVVRSFSLDDQQGNTVLTVERLTAAVDLDGLKKGIVRMPRGTASGVKVLLRRGDSGRVSLSDALRNSTEEPTPGKSPMHLNIGPLAVSDAELTIEMGDKPVVIHVEKATLRVQRTARDKAPKVFLSNIRGKLHKPDPLPQGVTIRGAEGVVDLMGGPLVDLRTRVCLGDSEMKLRVVVPERKTRTELTVDPSGPLGAAGLFALNIVSTVKSDKLSVGSGEVTVDDGDTCRESAAKQTEAQAVRGED
jgi:hypothetical protein